ncbi:MAG TPA: co-chaperone DjlA [Polyangiaceae bacterium]|nr:co-chaperone DjlA [Polyangiaceae bacterium]HYQ28674.1 co-chaperone DjlA [Polyangiaceae bacterium]
MYFIAICALVGLWFYGFAGLVLGGLVGSVLAYVALRERLRRVREQFIETTFAVMGTLCKADGVVTRDEIQVVEQIFALLRLGPEQKATAKAAFNRGKAPDFELDGAVAVFARVAPRGSILFQLFLQLQVMVVAADGQVHPAERAVLLRVARDLGLGERELDQLEVLIRAAAMPASAPSGVSPQRRLADAYTVLGIAPDASESEIKLAYRKLIRENHPDKIASKGLPESMRSVAEARSREINAAYELIKKTREFA